MSSFAPAREGHAVVLASCLLAMGGCERESQVRPSVQALPTVGNTSACNFAGFEGSVCREADNLHLTDLLRYPLLLRDQGWREVAGDAQANDEPFNEDASLWFERTVYSNCSELISVRLIPGPPQTSQGPVLLIRTDYEPACTEKAQ